MKSPRTRTLAVLTVAAAVAAALAFPPEAAAEGIERSTAFLVEGAYYLPDHQGYDSETMDIVADGAFLPIRYGTVGRLGSSWGPAEIQAMLRYTIEIPFLAGSGALTSGNNAAFSLTGALSPVSMRLEAEATLTPIAFLNVYAGALVGTGWNIGLFDGLGKILASGTADPGSFEGAVLKSWAGGTFQFDLAALLPGDWNHVVTVLSPRLQYAWFSDVQEGEAWMWEADRGENFNGWKLFGTYFLGYQMPLVLDTVGVLLETEQNIGYVADLSPAEAGGWGSDFVIITLGSVMNFALSERSSLAVLVQFRRERLYTRDTILDEYYATREYTGTYWDFRRIAFSFSLKL